MRIPRPTLAQVRRYWPMPAALMFLMLALWVILSLGSQRAAIATQSRQINALSGGLTTAESQLKAHGISPIPKPPSVIVSEVAGPAGPPGPAPSDSQVQAAVDDYLIAHPPTASVDPTALASTVDVYLSEHPPSPGPPPPSAEVAADVAAYLEANPPPSGPAGPAGSDGQQGPAGPQGEPGSPPAGWSWTDASGNSYECTEDGQSPAPHYTCAQASPSSSASPSAPSSSTVTQDTASSSPAGSATPTDIAAPTGTAATSATTPTRILGIIDAAAQSTRQHAAPSTPAGPTPSRGRVPFVLVLLRREDVPL